MISQTTPEPKSGLSPISSSKKSCYCTLTIIFNSHSSPVRPEQKNPPASSRLHSSTAPRRRGNPQGALSNQEPPLLREPGAHCHASASPLAPGAGRAVPASFSLRHLSLREGTPQPKLSSTTSSYEHRPVFTCKHTCASFQQVRAGMDARNEQTSP